MYEVSVTDMFCGGGGSSTGMGQIPGLKVQYAMNHWQLAVDTHNANHPTTKHDCADLAKVSPRRFARTDLLWASPECTNHSGAQGRRRLDAQPDMFDEVLPDEAAERSRATMWDVVRFTEAHRYEGIIVENVVEARRWELFDAWLSAMLKLGYQHEIVYLNSMHAQYAGMGAAQSRDRMYVCFWKTGNKRPKLQRVTRPEAMCSTCGPVRAMQGWKKPTPWGRYRAQYTYRCPNTACRNEVVEPMVRGAAEIIDWSLRGVRIGDRATVGKADLKPKTLARIQAGIDRYWRPMLVPVEGRDGKVAVPVDLPARTMTTRSETGLVVPSGGTWRTDAAPTCEPMSTRTTRETDGIAMAPFIAELRGGSSDARRASDPLATVCASGNHHGLVTTPLITAYYGNGSTTPADNPLSTVTTIDRHALLMRNNTGGAEMSTPVIEPARTITTGGHQSLLSAAGPTIDINDVLFRMLEPSEINAAMDFPTTYKMLGTRREQVRLAGNAVTPCAARDIVTVFVESLTGQQLVAA